MSRFRAALNVFDLPIQKPKSIVWGGRRSLAVSRLVCFFLSDRNDINRLKRLTASVWRDIRSLVQTYIG